MSEAHKANCPCEYCRDIKPMDMKRVNGAVSAWLQLQRNKKRIERLKAKNNALTDAYMRMMSGATAEETREFYKRLA